MSHGVAVEQAPAGFTALGYAEGAPVAAMADESRKLYGVQWHPEVKHSPLGQKLIDNFLHRAPRCPTIGMPPPLLRTRSRKSARRSAMPK